MMWEIFLPLAGGRRIGLGGLSLKMTLDSNRFFEWCVGVLVLVFAAGLLFVAFSAGVLR
jgi:hypothetical protein